MSRAGFNLLLTFSIAVTLFAGCHKVSREISLHTLRKGFKNPPESARPGVYWSFMDGNMTREGITRDLESMQEAGIGYVHFLEMNMGIPRGTVAFLSPEWQDLFTHAVKECERLGIVMSIGISPGKTGSGGPWVEVDKSMKQLVSGTLEVKGGGIRKLVLEVPPPQKSYSGESSLPPGLKKKWQEEN